MADEMHTVRSELTEDPTQRTQTTDHRDSVPSFKEIYDCVPKRCFKKHLPTSLAYLVWDFVAIAGMYYIEPYFEAFGLPGMILWYFLIGMFGFALFVVGHDCGHGTFSDKTWVNDICGHIAHAPLLAPYWPWQRSHRQHHIHTSHLVKDRGHAWITERVYKNWDWTHRQYFNNPLFSLIKWFMYTIAGVADGSHFWPFGSLFTTPLERIQCVISGLACALCAYVAFVLCDYNPQTYVKFYILPVLSQGFWLTMVTYLQHQSEDINVYEEGKWTYVMGQLQTIDRPYGFGIDYAMHHITDAHIAHHLFFTRIPHYHLAEATKSIREKLEPYGLYRYRVSYDFLWEFFRLNRSLEYLIGEGTGLLNYARSLTQKVE